MDTDERGDGGARLPASRWLWVLGGSRGRSPHQPKT